MEKKIYRFKVFPLLIIFLFFSSCGKVGPLVPRSQLIPQVPVVKKIFVSKKGVYFLTEFPIVNKGGFKLESTAVEVFSNKRKRIFYLKNLTRTNGLFIVNLDFKPKWFSLRLLSVYGKGRKTDRFYLPYNSYVPRPVVKKLEYLQGGLMVKLKKNKRLNGFLTYINNNDDIFPVDVISSDKIYYNSLKIGGRYDFYIVGVRKCEENIFCLSSPIVLRNIRIKDILPPPPPESVVAVRKKKYVTLKWTPVTVEDLAFYEIYRKKEFLGEWELLAKTIKNSYNDYTCDENRCYYGIKTVDKFGNKSVLSKYTEVGGK